MNYDKYKNKKIYPKSLNKPSMPKIGATSDDYLDYGNALKDWEKLKVQYDAEVKTYKVENTRLYNEFKQDLFDELGISENPKREILFEIAWNHGDKDYAAVYNYASELCDLIN